MHEKTLFKLSLICSLVGIFIILIINESYSLSYSNISLIDNSSIGKTVKVRGFIISISDSPGILIMNIQDKTSNIIVIAFKEDEINLQKNDLIEVSGIVKEYKDKLEIEAKEIKVY